MLTQSGIHVQTIGGADGTPTPEDIAVHAGRICRFGGAVWYPLLPHSVFVGLLAFRRSGSVHTMLWGFLHDAHECITSDVPRPFKCDCMRREQIAIDGRILTDYRLRPNDENDLRVDFDLVKQCDKDACDIEASTLELPNYFDAQGGDVYNNDSDKILFLRILNSQFAARDVVNGTFSQGVCAFRDALEVARSGDLAEFVEKVDGWRLLD